MKRKLEKLWYNILFKIDYYLFLEGKTDTQIESARRKREQAKHDEGWLIPFIKRLFSKKEKS